MPVASAGGVAGAEDDPAPAADGAVAIAAAAPAAAPASGAVAAGEDWLADDGAEGGVDDPEGSEGARAVCADGSTAGDGRAEGGRAAAAELVSVAGASRDGMLTCTPLRAVRGSESKTHGSRIAASRHRAAAPIRRLRARRFCGSAGSIASSLFAVEDRVAIRSVSGLGPGHASRR